MVREGLSQIIEHEMKEAYGSDLWYVFYTFKKEKKFYLLLCSTSMQP